jgi:D-glycero-D-manno-heptose 1,7-bisphosphate phosphatase
MSADEWTWEEGAREGLSLLCGAGVLVSVATNQAGIERGVLSREKLTAMHLRLRRECAEHGGTVGAIYVCPHVPESGCDCRKPRPGLIVRAIRESGLPRERTLMVGDQIQDLEAGRAAGVHVALVRTGKGTLTERAMPTELTPFVFDDLVHLARSIFPTPRSMA